MAVPSRVLLRRINRDRANIQIAGTNGRDHLTSYVNVSLAHLQFRHKWRPAYVAAGPRRMIRRRAAHALSLASPQIAPDSYIKVIRPSQIRHGFAP
ncbi:hypothetical protein DOI34_26010 [Salmonella enterica subsp. enterica serovar Virchow]|nr:hypothetical protein [Salmonella enterica subsp. enterica serovar Virchow]